MDLRSMTPRQQVFHELVQTEANYTAILRTILEVFKKNLEDPNLIGGQLLDQMAIKIIFGNLPPIYEIHSKMLAEFYQVGKVSFFWVYIHSDPFCFSSSSAVHFFPTILFLSTTMSGIADDPHLLEHAMASDFSVEWQFSQREQLFFCYVSNSTPFGKVSFCLEH
jgi:hypothetical protein